jgi:soluble lytic murein transglycosylase
MKQAIIAVVVLAAGGSTIYGLLGRHSAPEPTGPDMSIKTLSIKTDRVKPLPVRIVAKPGQIDSQPSEFSANIKVAPKLDPQPTAELLAGLQALSVRDSLAAIAIRDSLPRNSVEWMTLTWAIAVSGQKAVPSTELDMARAALKDWPALDDIDANYEQALYRESADPAVVLDAFSERMPETPEGAMILARTALEKGDKPRATRVLRSFWNDKTFDPVLEDKILSEFSGLLDEKDHYQRMVHLLFAEKLDQAKRFSVMAKAESLYAAFAATVRKSKNRKQLLAAVDAKWKNDPAFLYASVKQLRQAREYEDAAKLLEKMPRDRTLLGDPDAWWVEARIVSRTLMDDGKAKDAYDLATAHLAETPDDIAEAEFHAGWYALRGLKDTKKAEDHFNALLKASAKAHDQARGYYWLGRTAQAGGPGVAKDFYRKAAFYPATYYGQLAAAKLAIRIAPGERYQGSIEIETAFAKRPEMQAIALLEKAGEDGRARRLYLALAKKLESPSELQALGEIALRNHGASLALAVGKAALRQGHDPGLAAFPLGAIPDSADISGSGKALAYAIARQESAFNPSAISPANARGLLQILPATARKVAQKYQLAYADDKLIDDPAFNATLGSHYLGEQIDKFNGSYVLTFAAYNAGPGRIPQWIKRYGDPRGKDIDSVVDWVESIPFQETRDYVQKVMENFQVYKTLLNEDADISADLTAGVQ